MLALPTIERQGTSREPSASVGGLGYEVAMAESRREEFPNNFVGDLVPMPLRGNPLRAAAGDALPNP
jgi:hypothetical protein